MKNPLKGNLKGALGRAADTLGILLVIAAWLSVAHYWDPTRVYEKRLKAENSYVYDEIRPEHLSIDPSQFISIVDRKTAQAARRRLVQTIWGQPALPLDLLPDSIRQNLLDSQPDTADCPSLEFTNNETLLRLKCQLDRYKGWENLADIDELIVNVGPLYAASVAFFRPKTPNGILIVYQNGYASTYHHQYRHIERLIDAGFTVAAANHIGYGDNHCSITAEFTLWCDIGWGRYDVPLPMRVHFSPLVAAINYGLQQSSFDHIALIGFSAGGWLASVLAAADQRIDLSYPVAGFMPPFLQEEGERPPNQTYEPLFDAASMLDQFILAADSPGRRQVQFFNRYDRCCYANKRALLYAPEIKRRVATLEGGLFEVRIDETHALHNISRWTFESIVSDIVEHTGT